MAPPSRSTSTSSTSRAASALLLTHAHLVTRAASTTTAPLALGAVRIDDGRITHLYEEPTPPAAGARVIDLDGAFVLPGLIDAHLHLESLGAAAREVDVAAAPTEAAAAALTGAAAARADIDAWVIGRGWDQNRWPGQAYPTRRSLDAVAPDTPVALARVDGHAFWVNGAALAAAGIDRATAAPAGGEIRRGPDSEPTGVLLDNAMLMVLRALPRPRPHEIARDLRAALLHCRRAGLCGAHDMTTTPEVLAALEELACHDELPLAVTCYLDGTAAGIDAILAAPRRHGRLRVAGIKLFADGALGSHGAALAQPYSDAPAQRGLSVTSVEELASRLAAADRAAYQVAIHAIGDRANHAALAAVAHARPPRSAAPTGGGAAPRPLLPRARIEHAQILDADAIRGLRALGVVASMQPMHAIDDLSWVATRLGLERLQYAYPWRSVVDAGVPLAFGSDAPIARVSPLAGIAAAVRRVPPGCTPPHPCWLAQRLTFAEALEAYTGGAAAAGASDVPQLAAGAPADLTIVDRDPRTLSPDDNTAVVALSTFVGGAQP